jgi:hypothetical protein
MLRFVPITVECHAGYKGEELPRSFTWNDRRFEIEEIVDRWYQAGRDPTVPVCDYFKVRSVGTVFLLRMDRESFAWYLRDTASD